MAGVNKRNHSCPVYHFYKKVFFSAEHMGKKASVMQEIYSGSRVIIGEGQYAKRNFSLVQNSGYFNLCFFLCTALQNLLTELQS